MRILFDHNVPHKLNTLLPNHETRNAFQMGWAALQNGFLLRATEDAGFELMVTCDQNMVYQQNMKGRKLALVVLSDNNWNYIKRNAAPVVAAVDRATTGSYEFVTIRKV